MPQSRSAGGRRNGRGRDRLPSKLADNGLQNAEAVAKRAEVALSVNAIQLEARDLGDDEPRLCDPNVDQRLNLEPVAVDVDDRQAAGPERVVAGAEVGVARSVEKIDQTAQECVAHPAKPRDVSASSSLDEPRALREVGAVQERLDEAGDLGSVR